MKNLIVLISLACLFSCSNKYQDAENTADDYPIIPKPENLMMGKGRFLISSNTKIICDTSLRQEALFLSEMLGDALGTKLLVDSGAATKNNITLQLDPTIENPEGYTLTITYDKVVISGKGTAGVFYGIQSLRQ